MKNGHAVAAFEEAFADYVGARYAIALANGTATLHTAVQVLSGAARLKVAVPPLTMASTTLGVLHAECEPVFTDIDPDTWLMAVGPWDTHLQLPVSLYGLHQQWSGATVIDDAAQTLRPHGGAAFTSYSFQASKIVSTGEGGMLVTNDEGLAEKARSFSSLGYQLGASQPRISPASLKSPDTIRHVRYGWNYRMSDAQAEVGLAQLRAAGALKAIRQACAAMYREAIAGVPWLTPQAVPEGWQHDYWAFAVACDTRERALNVLNATIAHGGEAPYPAWRLTYTEPALRHLLAPMRQGGFDSAEVGDPLAARRLDPCPVAASLQPRLLQFQTNDLASAQRNARALRQAIDEAAR